MLNGKFRLWLLLSLLLAPLMASAAENDEDGVNPLLVVGVFEGLVAANAWLASQDPMAYGVAGALLFPIGAAEAESDTMFWVSLTAAESLAIYNMSIDTDRHSKSDIFRDNMIAWHVFVGVVGLTSWLTEDSEPEDKLALSFRPEQTGGGQLVLTYRF